MRLKTLMEEKHLDFNQPLLTVRRLCSTPDIREQRKPENSAPKLPLLPFYRSDLKSGPMSKPGTVPFIWEQAPGRPKNRAVTVLPNHTPKLPPGRITQIPNSDKDSNSVVCKESSSCLENDDESYLDALDTFSRSDSFFIDSPVTSSRFSSEQPGQDFMMDRFLPATKAVALEAPPARRPQVRQEQPRQIRLAVNGEKKVADNVVRNKIDGYKIKEDDSYVYDDSSAKLCGLLPRFCVLNPVTGLKMPTGRARLVRTRSGRSPYGGSGSYLGSKSRGRDGRTLEGSNLYKRLNENCGFPTQNAVPCATSNCLQHSQPELAKEAEKGKNFLELLASEGSEWGSGSMSPVVEKTLYMVTVKDSDPTEESNQESRPDTPKIDEAEQDLCEESSITDPSFMIPPPLPKTPSDSWLLKALDSKKSVQRAYIGMNVLDRTIVCKSVDGPKWETIVKTSKVHHGHLRFSEELLLPQIAESGVV